MTELPARTTHQAEAVIAARNAKNYYVAWRPITAIRSAAPHGNPLTDVDPDRRPLIGTPTFHEYRAREPAVS
jgi:hypothetical protein